MAISLGYDWTSITRAIAVELGFTRVAADWTDAEAEDIDDVVRDGMNLYYNPPLEQYARIRHVWSFLKPYLSIELASDTEEYELPAGFCGCDSNMITIRQDNIPDRNIQLINEEDYRRQRSQSAYVIGYPCFAATWPNASDGETEQTLTLGIWPTPLDGQTAIIQYTQVQEKISEDNPIPLGMPQYADVFRAAIMAATELKMDDERGKHWQTYVERALAAIAVDRRLNQGRTLGVMRDTDPDDCDQEDWHGGSVDYTVRTV